MMTYYLLLEHLEHPAKTINVVRAWGSSVRNSKTYQGMVQFCHFQAWLEVKHKTAVGRWHSCLSLNITKKGTCSAISVEELGHFKFNVYCPSNKMNFFIEQKLAKTVQ